MIRRIRTAAVGLLLVLVGAPARAEVFLVLPAGQAPASWGTPASVAGLTVAGGPRAAVGDDAVIRVEPNGAGWILRATNEAGVVRTARVAAPTTPADREEVAHLAAALARDLARPMVDRPTPAGSTARTTVIPPPPPSGSRRGAPPPPLVARATTPPPAPVRVDTVRVDTVRVDTVRASPIPAAAPPAPFPPPTAVEESPVGDVVASWTDLTLVGAFDARPAPPVTPPPSRSPRRRMLSPPLAAWTGAALRPDVQPAFLQTLGWEPARIGGSALALTVGFGGPRELRLDTDIERHTASWTLDLGLMRTFTRVIRAGPIAGAASSVPSVQVRSTKRSNVCSSAGWTTRMNSSQFVHLRTNSWSNDPSWIRMFAIASRTIVSVPGAGAIQ